MTTLVARDRPARPELLLRADRPPAPETSDESLKVRTARRIVTALLRRMDRGELIVAEAGTTQRFGEPDGHPRARIEILDGRAWTAVATEGSVGLGRGFVEGWWTTDDPVAVVRTIIGNLGAFDEARIALARVSGPAADWMRRISKRRTRRRDKDDIARHYDISNEFFALFLDETMTYSSAVFSSADQPLAEASLGKYDRLLDKLGVTPDHRVLEIGTGWGGFAMRTAERHRCSVTTTTVSDEQFREAAHRVHSRGLGGRITLLDRDWRDLRGSYDHVVSIEMIEAVDWRDLGRFFATIDRCLRPDGMVGLQAICVPDRRFHAAKTTEDFIRRFVFPGGNLSSIGSITRPAADTRLQLIDVDDLTAHYAETLNRWRARFDDRVDDVFALGMDERFCRLWRFYLAYCEAGFRERHITLNQFVLVGPQWRPDGLELRPH